MDRLEEARRDCEGLMERMLEAASERATSMEVARGDEDVQGEIEGKSGEGDRDHDGEGSGVRRLSDVFSAGEQE